MSDQVLTPAVSTPARTTIGRRVTLDSIWILAGYAVTSASGFVFWVVAARIIPPGKLGVDTAIFSIFTAAAQVAASGIGDALLVMLPGLRRWRRPLYRVGVLTAVLVATAAGVVAGVLVVRFVDPAAPAWSVVLGVTLSSVVWTLFVLKDPVLTSLGGARLNLTMNGPVNLAKLALIPVLVALVGAVGNPVLVAAVLPAAGALVVAYGILIPRRMRTFVPVVGNAAEPGPEVAPASTDEERPFRRFAAFAGRVGVANGLYLGGVLIMPFLVTTVAGSAQGALFALCFQIGQVLDLVVIAIGTSMATHASTNRSEAGALAFRTWLAVVTIVGLGVVALVALAPFVLGLLGHYYVAAGGVAVLSTLAIGSVLRTAYEVWGSMQRSLHRTTAVLVVSASSTVVLVPVAILCIGAWGALGGAIAMVVTTVGLAAVGFVGLLRARHAPGTGRHSAVASPAPITGGAA
ncbi:hypothetical protein DEI81_15615 [Curtobacterium sp. MCBD17_013]|uniref:lipopolysaccharide biosynthesis protein n=1 Tax=Curtobacterium sp. MCBD17_013 TaxID=2175668 RepID=UPI000DA91CE6|nr:hypothetical protein [Curtobacterium sp. MCBD17_013]PZF57080.1 hypothetical protein DEI81_15615 [Curtobacterium sp. MCBD17_013]